MIKRLKIFALAAAIAVAGCEPYEPSCPRECEEIREGEELTACQCHPDFFGDCRDEDEPWPPDPFEEDCEE